MTPRSRTGRRSLPLILSAFAFLTTVAVARLYLAHTLHADSVVIARGETMGTTGEIRVAERDLGERLRNEVELEAEKRLAEIDRWMSNWNPESEVSRFNAYRGTDPFPVSYETAELVAYSAEVTQITNRSDKEQMAVAVPVNGWDRRQWRSSRKE